MSGLTAEGFLAKRLPEIKADLEAEYQAQFGVDLNFSPETVFGQLVGIESEAFSNFWATVDDVYQSQYPATANGAALDLLADINGITRRADLPTTVEGYMMLSTGATVPAGSKAKDGTNTYTLQDTVTHNVVLSYGAILTVASVADSTDYSITIGGALYTFTSGIGATTGTILTGLAAALPGAMDVTVGASSLTVTYVGPAAVSVSANLGISAVVNVGTFQSDVTGPLALPVGALSEIETPIAGWQSVTNRSEGTMGRNRETDGELRVRRAASVRLNAISTVDGITAQLLQLEDVLSARVIENNTDVTDSNGVPPHSIWTIVEGGAAADIAQTIFNRKAGGIGMFGDVSENAFSTVNGQAYEVLFSRPQTIPVYIDITLTASASLPADYAAAIRSALETFGDTLDIGEDLITNRLYCPINDAIDDMSYVTEILIDVTPSPATSANLFADENQRFQIIAGNVNVFVS